MGVPSGFSVAPRMGFLPPRDRWRSLCPTVMSILTLCTCCQVDFDVAGGVAVQTDGRAPASIDHAVAGPAKTVRELFYIDMDRRQLRDIDYRQHYFDVDWPASRCVSRQSPVPGRWPGPGHSGRPG